MKMATDVLVPQLLSFAKSAHHSRVHRPTYPDYITVDRYDDDGNVIGEWCFFGLFTSTVYNESPLNIPLLRRKLKAVMDIAWFNPQGHNGKQLLQVLEVYPRDDLFQIYNRSWPVRHSVFLTSANAVKCACLFARTSAVSLLTPGLSLCSKRCVLYRPAPAHTNDAMR